MLILQDNCWYLSLRSKYTKINQINIIKKILCNTYKFIIYNNHIGNYNNCNTI